MRRAMLFFYAMGVALAGYGQSLEDVTTITFTKQSRGFVDEVIISRDSVRGFMENHRTPEDTRHYTKDVETDAWAGLMMSLQGVPLADIDGLQSPTTNRAHDAAIHSSITITFEDGSSVSHSFDDENPHPDLRPFLDAINDFRLTSPKYR